MEKMKYVKIQNTEITEVHEKGLDLHVAHLGVFGSHFGTLMTGALAIKTERPVVLDNVSIGLLSSHALVGIKLTNSGIEAPALITSNLSIKHTEYGSLTLSHETNVSVAGLEGNTSAGRTRSPEEFVSRLVGKPVGDNWTTADELEQLGNRPHRPTPRHAHSAATAEPSVAEGEELLTEAGEGHISRQSNEDVISDGTEMDNASSEPGRTFQIADNGETGSHAGESTSLTEDRGLRRIFE